MTLDYTKKLDFAEEELARILYRNAAELLGITDLIEIDGLLG